MFLGKGVLKICSKFTGEHPCRNAISIKLLCNFIEIALRHVNLLHIFRTPFPKNTSERLLPFFVKFEDLNMEMKIWFTWIDERLTHGKSQKLSINEDFFMDKVWLPDAFIVNAKQVRFHKTTEKNRVLRISNSGMVEYDLR